MGNTGEMGVWKGESQKIPPLPSLNTLVFDHEALKQSVSCGGSVTAVKKGPSFQEGVSGGFRKAILQTPRRSGCSEVTLVPERGKALLRSTGDCQGPV